MINYQIIPSLITEDEYLTGLFGEISSLTLESLTDLIAEFEIATTSATGSKSIYFEVSHISVNKHLTRIFWTDQLVKEVPTKELYNIVVEFRMTVIAYKNIQTTNR